MKNKLNKEEKEAIGILSLGTFLEYFDLLLYIHMISLLNNIFFAPTDRASSALLASFAYCINYLVRPLGSILMGWLGDIKGRKYTIQMTLFMTAFSSMTIFILPPYLAIGVTASVIITLCRITQSLSSLGEVIGAEIYISELIKGKMRYVAIGCIVVLAGCGSLAALGVAHFATTGTFNWRYAFLFGGIIAIAGGFSRSRLRDTTYVTGKEGSAMGGKKLFELLLNSFFMQNLHVICWFVSFLACSEILRERFGYNDIDVINNSFKLTLTILISCVIHTLLYFKYSPIKISFWRNHAMIALALASPFVLTYATEPFHILLLQAGFMILGANEIAAIAIRTNNTPANIRFRAEAVMAAISGVLVSLICTFGLTVLKPVLGNYAFATFLVPMSIMYHIGLRYFAKLDRANPDGCYAIYDKVEMSDTFHEEGTVNTITGKVALSAGGENPILPNLKNNGFGRCEFEQSDLGERINTDTGYSTDYIHQGYANIRDDLDKAFENSFTLLMKESEIKPKLGEYLTAIKPVKAKPKKRKKPQLKVEKQNSK